MSDVSHFPVDIQDQIRALNQELEEGEITQKGYEKKKQAIIEAFHQKQISSVQQLPKQRLIEILDDLPPPPPPLAQAQNRAANAANHQSQKTSTENTEEHALTPPNIDAQKLKLSKPVMVKKPSVPDFHSSNSGQVPNKALENSTSSATEIARNRSLERIPLANSTPTQFPRQPSQNSLQTSPGSTQNATTLAQDLNTSGSSVQQMIRGMEFKNLDFKGSMQRNKSQEMILAQGNTQENPDDFKSPPEATSPENTQQLPAVRRRPQKADPSKKVVAVGSQRKKLLMFGDIAQEFKVKQRASMMMPFEGVVLSPEQVNPSDILAASKNLGPFKSDHSLVSPDADINSSNESLPVVSTEANIPKCDSISDVRVNSPAARGLKRDVSADRQPQKPKSKLAQELPTAELEEIDSFQSSEDLKPHQPNHNLNYQTGTISKNMGAMMRAKKVMSVIYEKAPEQHQNSAQPARSLNVTVTDNILNTDFQSYKSLVALLRARATLTPKSYVFSSYDEKGREVADITYEKLVGHAEKIAQLMIEKGKIEKGDRVMLLYRKTEITEFAVALFGCFFAGAVAVPFVSNPHYQQSQEMAEILVRTSSKIVLTTEFNIKALSREIPKKFAWPQNVEWWKTNGIGTYTPSKKSVLEFTIPDGDDIAYIEYSRCIVGNLKGVVIPHSAVMNQCMMLKCLHDIRPKDIMLNSTEYRQQSGLLLSVFTGIYCGMHVHNIPAHAADIPGIWMSMIHKTRATVAAIDITCVRQIVRHLQDHASESMKNQWKSGVPDLSCLRKTWLMSHPPNIRIDSSLIANFSEQLQRYKLSSDALILPVCSLPEYGGIIIATHAHDQHVFPPKTLYLDSGALRRNKVQIFAEKNANTITVRDSGAVFPETTLAIVDPKTRTLRPNQAVGEIWINCSYVPIKFEGDEQHSEFIFSARLNGADAGDGQFLRTGYIGFMSENRLFVLGHLFEYLECKENGFSSAAPLFYYSSDINRLVLKEFNMLQQCASFAIMLSDIELCVIACEVTSETIEKEKLNEMGNRIASLLQNRMGLCPYSLIFCKPDSLPRSKDNSLNIEQIRKRFDTGTLAGLHVCMFVQATTRASTIQSAVSLDGETQDEFLTRIEHADQPSFDRQSSLQVADGNTICPVGVGVGTIDQPTRQDLLQFDTLTRLLIWRVQTHPEQSMYTLVDSRGRASKKISFRKLSLKAAKLAHFLMEKKQIASGTPVLLLYPPGSKFVVACHACFYAGFVLIPFPYVNFDGSPLTAKIFCEVIKRLGVKYIFTISPHDEVLKSRVLQPFIRSILGEGGMPPVVNTSKPPSSNRSMEISLHENALRSLSESQTAVIQLNIINDERWEAAFMSHETVISQCMMMKESLNASPVQPLIAAGQVYSGLGFLNAVVLGMFTGSGTCLLESSALSENPTAFFETIMKNEVKDACTTFRILDHMRKKPVSEKIQLSSLKALLVPSSERPESESVELFQQFSQQIMHHDRLSTAFQSTSHPYISSRAYLKCPVQTIHLNVKALKYGQVSVVDSNTSHGYISVYDVGRISPTTCVVILNSQTNTVCKSGEIGEIWVAGLATADQSMQVSSDNNVVLSHASRLLETKKLGLSDEWHDLPFIFTGSFGFLHSAPIVNYNTELDESCSEVDGQLLYVLGTVDSMIKCLETDTNKELVFFCQDLEETIEKSNTDIVSGGCAIIQSPKLGLIAVVELKNHITTAINCVSVITNAVLDEYFLALNQIVFIEPESLPKSRTGQKMRRLIREQLETDELYYLSQHTIE